MNEVKEWMKTTAAHIREVMRHPSPDRAEDLRRETRIVEIIAAHAPAEAAPDSAGEASAAQKEPMREELVRRLAAELYDCFMMGGMEPQDAYPEIRQLLDAYELEAVAAPAQSLYEAAAPTFEAFWDLQQKWPKHQRADVYDIAKFVWHAAHEAGRQEGWEAAIEAAALAICEGCKKGMPLSGQWHEWKVEGGAGTMLCKAIAIRALLYPGSPVRQGREKR
jgi:hypothetical protein